MPDLFPENIDAIRVWGLVADQRIYAGMDGISMGLKHEAIWKLIDEFEIKERIETFEKVLKVYDAVRELEQKKRDEMEKK